MSKSMMFLLCVFLILVICKHCKAITPDEVKIEDGQHGSVAITIKMGLCKGHFIGNQKDLEDYVNEKKDGSFDRFLERFTLEAGKRGCL